jgi:small subunit ribosomal protein S6
LNQYELILIIDPAMGEDKVAHVVAKIEERIKGFGGEIEKTEKWGVKRLASMMKKAKSLTQGAYTMIRFKSAPSVPAEVKAHLKVNENVVRYFLSRAVILPEARPERPGIAGAPIDALAVGEIKGEPLGESK